METTIDLDIIRPQRVAGSATNFVGEGWLSRVKGSPVRGAKARATVALDDAKAQEATAWMLENLGHAFPFSFVEGNRIIGLQINAEQMARV